MVKSMTGFGKTSVEFPGRTCSVEIRSVNSKVLDLAVKLPFVYRDKEQEIRAMVGKVVERGKADFNLVIEEASITENFSINKEMVIAYYKELKEVSAQVGEQANLLNSIMKLPDVIKKKANEPNEHEWEKIKQSIELALEKLNQFRMDEGLGLKTDLMNRINHILNYLKEVEPLEEQRLKEVRERLMKSIENNAPELNIDKNRFEQELIYYLEKLDICEEKTRLQKHCDYFLETIQENSSGRKLGFISQEIGREINTMGSKANYVAIQKLVVQMKDELEKIKEQVLNVL